MSPTKVETPPSVKKCHNKSLSDKIRKSPWYLLRGDFRSLLFLDIIFLWYSGGPFLRGEYFCLIFGFLEDIGEIAIASGTTRERYSYCFRFCNELPVLWGHWDGVRFSLMTLTNYGWRLWMKYPACRRRCAMPSFRGRALVDGVGQWRSIRVSVYWGLLNFGGLPWAVIFSSHRFRENRDYQGKGADGGRVK